MTVSRLSSGIGSFAEMSRTPRSGENRLIPTILGQNAAGLRISL